MKPPKNFDKIAVLKIWQLVFFWGVKTHFGEIPLKLCIIRHDIFYFHQIAPLMEIFSPNVVCIVYRWYFWFILETITYPKDNFCFYESMLQWQIKLISHRSGFWHLRKNTALILSKCLFFQNSLGLSWHIIR